MNLDIVSLDEVSEDACSFGQVRSGGESDGIDGEVVRARAAVGHELKKIRFTDQGHTALRFQRDMVSALFGDRHTGLREIALTYLHDSVAREAVHRAAPLGPVQSKLRTSIRGVGGRRAAFCVQNNVSGDARAFV